MDVRTDFTSGHVQMTQSPSWIQWPSQQRTHH